MKTVKQAILDTWEIPLFLAIVFIKVFSLNFIIKIYGGNTVSIQLIAGCLGSTLILISFAFLFNRNGRLKWLFIIDIIVTLIIITDTVYDRYFSDVTSVALIQQAKLVGEVGNSVKSLIHLSDFIYLIDIIILIPLFILLKRRGQLKGKMPIFKKVVFCVIMFGVGLLMSHASAAALEKDQPGLLKTMYDKKYVVGQIGDLNFHGFDLYRYVCRNVLEKDKITDQEKKSIGQWYEKKNETSTVKYYNSMKGKNLIVVQLESFQGFVLNRTINGQEITPNLNKLSKDSLVFDNYYYETAWGGTSDAEFLSNVSLLPSRDGSVYYQYAGDTYDSIISNLKSKGYYTAVMHANRPGFWNRAQMYKSLGFDKFENENTLKIDDVVGMGLSDKSFFKQAVSKMKGYKQPFYTFMISLSSHFPFKDSTGKLDNLLDTGEFKGQLLGDYLNSVKYTDSAIGELVDTLKSSGLWDNSVVVFYGDHSAVPYEDRGQLGKLLYNKNDMTPLEWFNAQKVVAMIHFPNETMKGHSTITAGEMDLYPTLANLFGIKASYALGQDLLNAKNGFMVTRDRGWADNNIAYLQSTNKVVDIKTGNELDNNSYKSESNKAKKYLEVSDATIENNLINYFKNELNNYATLGSTPDKDN